MAKRNRFPPEADTQPDIARPPASPSASRTSGAAPKPKRPRSEVPTEPPPRSRRTGRPIEPRTSGVQEKGVRRPSDSPRADVDEVTADLSKDPRRERE